VLAISTPLPLRGGLPQPGSGAINTSTPGRRRVDTETDNAAEQDVACRHYLVREASVLTPWL
jgi:hypothetical protein